VCSIISSNHTSSCSKAKAELGPGAVERRDIRTNIGGKTMMKIAMESKKVWEYKNLLIKALF
jgi:hypothetical protein